MPIPTRPDLTRKGLNPSGQGPDPVRTGPRREGHPNPEAEVPVLPSSLRIAIVVERFAPTGGGVEKVAWRVANELERLDVDVTVLTRSADAQLVTDTRSAPSVQLLRVPTVWQPLRVAAFSRAAARVAKREGFDVVHSFSRTRQQDLYRAGGGSHREYLRHNYPSDPTSPGARVAAWLRPSSPRHRTLLGIEEAVFKDPAQRIQCASKFVADALIARHDVARERILLLPNAVDAMRFGTDDALAAGRRLRAEIDEKAERIWLFPASGWKRKGLTTLFEATARLRDPGLRLWIAGRDQPEPWQKIATRLGIADQIRFLGPRDDLEIVYGAVDGMVLPTRYDAFANVTLEAAASGLPIVTTNTNGAAEWLGEAVVQLNDSRDTDALADALRTLSDFERRRRLGERAQQIARSMDWPAHAAALCEEYRRIVEGRGKRAKDLKQSGRGLS
jgi:UDP-glucose:(heptosyl)LPS alpha-1,3-glucosyltransferase